MFYIMIIMLTDRLKSSCGIYWKFVPAIGLKRNGI